MRVFVKMKHDFCNFKLYEVTTIHGDRHVVTAGPRMRLNDIIADRFKNSEMVWVNKDTYHEFKTCALANYLEKYGIEQDKSFFKNEES